MLDGSAQVPTDITVVMGDSAPDPIPQVNTSSADGRHRTLTWRVPVANGKQILQYSIRRVGPSPAPTEHFYSVLCTGDTTVAAAPTTAISYPSLTCTPGEMMELTLGLDVFPTDVEYIVPTETYSWSVIAINDKNDGCVDGGTCKEYDGNWRTVAPYGSWSPIDPHLQGQR